MQAEAQGAAVLALIIDPELPDGKKGDVEILLVGRTDTQKVVRDLATGATSLIGKMTGNSFDAAICANMLIEDIRKCMRDKENQYEEFTTKDADPVVEALEKMVKEAKGE